MKKLLLLTILSLLTSTTELHADHNSETILAKLRTKVRSYSSYQLDFRVAMQGEGTANGSLTVSGQRFVAKVMGQELYYDGSTLWIYIPRDREVTVERLDPNNPSALSNPSKLLNIAPGDYNHRTLDPLTTTKGSVLQVIELTPKSKSPDYTHLTLYVNPTTSLPERIAISTSSSVMPIELFFKELTSNIPVTESTFQFNTKDNPQVEIIDFQ